MSNNHLYTILPFLTLMMGEQSSYLRFVPLLFMLPMVWKFIKDSWRWVFHQRQTLTIIQKLDKHKNERNINFTFEAVSYFVRNWKNIDLNKKNESLKCERSKYGFQAKYQTDVGNYYSYEPILVPCGEKKLKYKEHILCFDFFETDNSKRIQISGAPMTILEQFVLKSIKDYEEHLYVKKDDKLYIHNYNNQNEAWDKTEIRVKKNMNNIFLANNIKTELVNDLQQFFQNEDYYKEMGIPYKRAYLFYGPPGTGKSSTCYALSGLYNYNIYKLSPKRSNWKQIRKAISLIPPKNIVLIEEIDTQVENKRNKTPEDSDATKNTKDSDTTSGVGIVSLLDTKIDLSEMLDILDGYECLHECVVICTTNFPDLLDKALIRAGRMDIHFNFDHLGKKEVTEAIQCMIGKDAIHDINIDENIKIESAKLINEILIPNRNNIAKINKHLNGFTQNDKKINLQQL